MQGSISSRLLLAVLGLTLLGFGIAFGLKALRSRSPTANPAAQSAQEQSPEASANAANAGEDSELREVSPAQLAKATQLPAVIQPAGRPAPNSVPPVARVQPTAYTRQLVAGLTNLNLSHGPITKEQADQWKQGLQALTQQGAAGVPAIREFLEQNQELNFAAINGGQLLEQPSLRAALINTLQQIGGPEATGAMLQAPRPWNSSRPNGNTTRPCRWPGCRTARACPLWFTRRKTRREEASAISLSRCWRR